MKYLTALVFFLLTLPVVAQAQEEPPQGMSELQAYSVFVDAYKSDDYEMALKFGEWIIEAAPRELEGYSQFSLERQFDRMVDVYVGAAEQAEDPSVKSEHLEEAEQVFEKFYETFSADEVDMFEWKLNEGRFYHENRENMDADIDDAMESYREAYEMDPERFATEGEGFFARVVLTEYADDGQRDKAFEMIDNIESYASGELQSTIDEVRESLFENPEERIEFIESRIADAEENEREEMLNNLVTLYDEVGEEEKSREAALDLYEMNDNYENTQAVADLYLSSGDYEQAIEYLKEASQKTDNDDAKKEIALDIAESYQQIDQFEQARDFARQAIQIDPESGEAYMSMASIYAGAISNCVDGSKLDREDRAVYWLVLDYLDEAKEVDSSVASSAESRAESYAEAMPSDEDKFFSQWEVGDSFQIDGDLKDCYAWIEETTVVR